MAQEFDKKKKPQITSITDKEMTENDGSESQSNAEDENFVENNTLQPSGESMDLQLVAENDTVLSSIENSTAPKRTIKRKLNRKTFCELLLGEVNQSQQGALDKISMMDGLKEMKESLQNAERAQQSKHLCMLLAQCWKANICIFHLAETGIGATVRDLNRQYPDIEVKKAAREVLQKWRAAVTEDERKTTAEYLASKSASSSSTAAASVSSNSQSSTSTKANKKKESVVTRPNAANSKFRSTGLAKNIEEGPPSKKQAFSSSAPFATRATSKKSLGNASVSYTFANALSVGSTVNVKKLQRKPKMPPSIVDLLLNSPLKQAATPSSHVPSAPVAQIVPELDENGPDPSRVRAPDVPRNKRKVHFADDKGQELVHIQYIENVLFNKRRLSSFDMKHADAKAERNSLKQLKSGAVVEEEDVDDEEMKTNIQSTGNVESDDTWKPVPYNVNEEISQKHENEEDGLHQQLNYLFVEEDVRCKNVMRTFVADPEVPLEHPDEPDNVPTPMRTPENIPLDYVLQKLAEKESMKTDAFISSAKDLPTIDRVVPMCFLPTSHPQVSASNVTNIQLTSNVDVHGPRYYNSPIQTATQIPLNSIFFSCPPSIAQQKPPSQTIPPSIEEFVIMADETSKLNAPPSFSNAPVITKQSSGNICKFFLKGKCKFGNDCIKEHSQPQQQQPAMGSYGGNAVLRFNLNNQENGSVCGDGDRFNLSGLKKTPFSLSNQVPVESQDQDNLRRSKKNHKRSNDLREDGRSQRSRSPTSRKGKRSPSYDDSPRKYRRRRSQSPVSRSSSYVKKEDSRKRRRSRAPQSSGPSSHKNKCSR